MYFFIKFCFLCILLLGYFFFPAGLHQLLIEVHLLICYQEDVLGSPGHQVAHIIHVCALE